jgi:hypothetical protein
VSTSTGLAITDYFEMDNEVSENGTTPTSAPVARW